MCTAMSVNGGDCGFEGGSSGSSQSGAVRRKEQEQSDGNMRYEHYVLFAFLPSEGGHRQRVEGTNHTVIAQRIDCQYHNIAVDCHVSELTRGSALTGNSIVDFSKSLRQL